MLWNKIFIDTNLNIVDIYFLKNNNKCNNNKGSLVIESKSDLKLLNFCFCMKYETVERSDLCNFMQTVNLVQGILCIRQKIFQVPENPEKYSKLCLSRILSTIENFSVPVNSALGWGLVYCIDKTSFTLSNIKVI